MQSGLIVAAHSPGLVRKEAAEIHNGQPIVGCIIVWMSQTIISNAILPQKLDNHRDSRNSIRGYLRITIR